jgi:hypothetical protein
VTYDEVLAAIGRGNKNDWLKIGGAWVYKYDLLLHIEEAKEVPSLAGSRFSEPWVKELTTADPAERVVFFVCYGVNRVMEIHTVLVDRRTIVPLTDSQDYFSMDRWNYSFGKIVEEYSDTDLSGIYSLDTILERAGITVRDY